MKNKIKLLMIAGFLLFSFFVSSEKSLAAKGWIMVGSQINGNLYGTDIVFSQQTGTPYIVFNRTLDDKLVVMKFDGNDWVGVGTPGFTGNPVRSFSLAMNPQTDEPYIAFSQDNGADISVMKFNGIGWNFVGSERFFLGSGSWETGPSLAFDPVSNNPYVAFRDTITVDKLSVMRFNGASWVIVGSAGVSIGAMDNAKLVFNTLTSEPYVSFRDESNSGKITVMRFNETAWSTVGVPGFNAGSSFSISLAFNELDNSPHVAFYENGGVGSVMRFDGDSWGYVGLQNFLDGGINGIQNTKLVFNLNTNEPYVAYTVGTLGLSVKRFDGDNWSLVGEENFTPGEANRVAFSVDPINNIPYVFFKGPYSEGSEVYRPIIMKYDEIMVDSMAPSAPSGLGVI